MTEPITKDGSDVADLLASLSKYDGKGRTNPHSGGEGDSKRNVLLTSDMLLESLSVTSEQFFKKETRSEITEKEEEILEVSAELLSSDDDTIPSENLPFKPRLTRSGTRKPIVLRQNLRSRISMPTPKKKENTTTLNDKRKRSSLSDVKSINPLNSKKVKSDVSPNERQKKFTNDRLSFQEAAVRVLADQRQQGVHALSTRRIWDLIMQSDLVDTKCKTPISSLSSRITEDVRTKGNKSVFVRVGEGLYCLRKGLKKNELEAYLAANHTNEELDEAFITNKNGPSNDSANSLNENLIEEQTSVVSEENGVGAINGGQGEEVEAARTRETRLLTKSEVSKTLANDAGSTWVGLPLKTKCNGNIYYSAVTIRNVRFRIGDCAFFRPNSDDQIPYIGQITKLWQAPYDDRSSSLISSMFVKCVWYYYPEDTASGRAKKAHKRELFLSDLADVNSVNSLISVVQVVNFEEFNKKLSVASKSELKRLYFCRSFFNENTKEFIPFDIESNHHVRIEFNDNLTPKNWPKSKELVTYAYNTDWGGSERYRHYFLSKAVSKVEIASRNGEEDQLGCFAKEDISSGTVIGEYTGRTFIESLVGDSQDGEVENQDPRYAYKLYEDDEVNVSLNSSQVGNEFRWVRECFDGMIPNIKFVPMWINSWHLLVTAIRDIKKGDELLVEMRREKKGVSKPKTDVEL